MKNHQWGRAMSVTAFVISVLFICAGYSFAGDYSVISSSGASWQDMGDPGYSISASYPEPFQPVSSSRSSSSASSWRSSDTKTSDTTSSDTKAEAVSDDPADYKEATKYAEADNADIKSVAENLTKNCTTDKEKAQAIFNYVSDNYAYKFYFRTAAGAEEMLGKNEGNGPDQSHLFVALCRAAGLSARYRHVMAGNTAGMGDGVPDEVDRIYAQVYVDGEWLDADPADKRNKDIGDLTISVKYDIATYNEYDHANETDVTLSSKTELSEAEITAYNRYQNVTLQNGIAMWPDASRGLPEDGKEYEESQTPLTFDEVKDYIKYQNVEVIGDHHYFLAEEEISKEKLSTDEIAEYQKYKDLDKAKDTILPLEECKKYIKYSEVVKDGEDYYWSEDALNDAKDKKDEEKTEYGDGMDQYLKPDASSSALQAKAEQLTEGKTTDYDKAKAIYDWVNNNKSYTQYNNTSKGAAGMLSASSGNCCDQAHLIVALSRAAGLPARYVHNTSCNFSDVQDIGHVWAQIYVDGEWTDADAVSSRDSFGHVAFTTNRNNDRIYDILPF